MQQALLTSLSQPGTPDCKKKLIDFAFMLGESVLRSYLGFVFKAYYRAGTCVEKTLSDTRSSYMFQKGTNFIGCLENQAAPRIEETTQ